MKIKVYQSAIGIYREMEVKGKYRYKGESKGISLTKGKIYYCVGVDTYYNELRIVDDTGEDYLYSPDDFEKIEE